MAHDILADLMLGLNTAVSPVNLGFVVLGVLVGIFIGVLPGVGAVTAIALLLPMSLKLPAQSSLILLAGIWYGSTFGGSITAVLLNIPGTTSNAVTCLDGHAMTRRGRAGVALVTAVGASFIGGSLGILTIMLFTAPIARLAVGFSSVEYFSLMVMGLVAASSVGGGSMAKGLAMTVIGVMIGTVGTDLYSGLPRFTFGNLHLLDGIGLVAVSMGVFGLAELIITAARDGRASPERKGLGFRAMVPSREDRRRLPGPVARGSLIGILLGTLPGTGPAIAAFLAYATELRVTRTPERFGKGAIEGVAAPESANNAADMTAFIPTLALGIPGSATMALMLGALVVNGIAPGPDLITREPALFWGLVVSFWIGNVILLGLSLPLIGLWVRLLTVPFRLLMPAILAFICIGAYSVSTSLTDVWLVAALGVLGVLARLFDFPAAPLLLGFVLGPMLEDHFRRAMLVSRGDLMVFLQHPVSAALLAVTLALAIWNIRSGLVARSGRGPRRREEARQG